MEYLRDTPLPQGSSEVTLRIPAAVHFQLVFRQELAQAFEVARRDDLEFIFVDSVASALRALSLLRCLYKWPGALKAALKVARGRRYFYAVVGRGQALHTGWINDSFCRFYRVASGGLVIGPIWSAEAARGLGLGTYATQLAMNQMFHRGRSVFYIDTSNTNVPCLKLIEHCGFGHPIASFIRE